MKSPLALLEERISTAMVAVSGLTDCSAIVRPSTDPKFGDYQANGVMALAKKLKTNPRKLAEEIVNNLNVEDIAEPPEIAGPGFINLRLKPDFLAEKLLEINSDCANRLGIEKVSKPKTIVTDFSGPNIAKQMHVGHLRSTIIGDCICRLLEFLGHKVIRQNHIGDWGTQFGRVILGLWHLCMADNHGAVPYYESDLEDIQSCAEDKDKLKLVCIQIRDRHEQDWREDSLEAPGDGKKFFQPFLRKLTLGKIPNIWQKFLRVYQYMNILEDRTAGLGLTSPTRTRSPETGEWKIEDIPYEFISRRVTVMLQDRSPDNEQEYEAWEYVTELTLDECFDVYNELSVEFNRETDIRGESSYKDILPDVVGDLQKLGFAEESDGATCVFPEGFKNKQGEPLPLIVQKTDGAFLYATTDLAAIRYRVGQLNANRIVYVTDARQSLHFEMVFAVARMAGWVQGDTKLVHVTFGSVMGEGGKPLKTRSGENVKLKELLDEAVKRARAVVEQKNPDLDEAQKSEIAAAIGIGAVKYADYSNNRTSDYIFSFDKMLAMDGNTAPYMQYAYARIKSIERKAQTRDVDVATELARIDALNLTEPAELDLAKYLLRYGEAIEFAAADYKPNFLTAYLYELAQKFSTFYTNCHVLGADADKRPTRLLLCDLTANTIRHGLCELLGIEVVEQM